MHTTFNPESIDWSVFILPITSSESDPAIGAIQYGFGSPASNYAIFRGLPYQRGAGIGSIFRSLLRYILPMGKALGQEGIDTSQRILNSVLKGDNVKDAILTEGRDGLKNIMDRASQKLARQSGEGGVGKYKKNAVTHKLPPIPKGRNLRTIIPPPSLNTNSLLQQQLQKKKRSTSKRERIDSLGFY